MNIELISSLKGPEDRVWDVAWHPQGNLLAACGGDKVIYLWGCTGDEWSLKAKLTDGHNRTIRCVSWSPDGSRLASASFDGTVAIWDKSGGQFECNITLEGHENEVKCVTWSPSGSLLATCGRDKSVWVWEVTDDGEFDCAAVLTNHTQDVKKVAWHPQKEQLVSVSYDNSIKMYAEDDDEWVCIDTLGTHDSTVWGAAFSGDGALLATSSDDRSIKIWKKYEEGNPLGVREPWKCVCTLSGYHRLPVYDLSWCPQTGLLASACGDDGVRVFRDNGEGSEDEPQWEMCTSKYSAHEQDVNAVAWNPKQSGLLASASDDGTVKIWRVK